MIIITAGEMLMFPFVNTFWVSRSNEYNRGQYAALFAMSFALGQVLAPTFGSQIVQHSGYTCSMVCRFWFVYGFIDRLLQF